MSEPDNSINARIRIEVAYATPRKQVILELETAANTLPRDAIRASAIVDQFPEIDPETCDIGVFGKPIADDYDLDDGDRIEIYRPLVADPKEIRRQRAAQGLQMKKGGGAISSD